jgi:hypothetical protein
MRITPMTNQNELRIGKGEFGESLRFPQYLIPGAFTGRFYRFKVSRLRAF